MGRAKGDDIHICRTRVERRRLIKGISRSLRTKLLKKPRISRSFAPLRVSIFSLAAILVSSQPQARALAPHHLPPPPHHQILRADRIEVRLARRQTACVAASYRHDRHREVEAVDDADVVEMDRAGVCPEGQLDDGGRRLLSGAHAAELAVAVAGQARAVARAVEVAALSGPHSARPPLGGLDRLVVAAVEVEAAAV